MFRFTCLILSALPFFPYSAEADKPASLVAEIQAIDQKLFGEGFNKCDMDIFRAHLHPDLEFLHDVSGESNYTQFLSVFESQICDNSNGKLTRKLLPDSSSVYPLNNAGGLYAAVQMGKHEFYFTPTGGTAALASTAKFVHTYFLVDGDWKLKRVISYDHQEPESSKQDEQPSVRNER